MNEVGRVWDECAKEGGYYFIFDMDRQEIPCPECQTTTEQDEAHSGNMPSAMWNDLIVGHFGIIVTMVGILRQYFGMTLQQVLEEVRQRRPWVLNYCRVREGETMKKCHV